MKTATLTLFVLGLLVVSALPTVLANSVGSGVTPDITTEQFAPLVWMCDHRIVYDDGTEPGRISNDGQYLIERLRNYAFEGEQIQWEILVMDKNGIQKVSDVYATVGSSQGAGNDIQANCVRESTGVPQYLGPSVPGGNLPASCNARILEEQLLNFDSRTMAFYKCTFTVETPDSMYGEYWLTVEAVDLNGDMGTMAENEYWYFNPVIALSVDGALTFDNVRPGTTAYSNTLLVGNNADEGSGVEMDMFISGTDFYDSSSSGAACPDTNQLQLQGRGADNQWNTADDTGFFYFATNGAYSTSQDLKIDNNVANGRHRWCDAEGYCNIQYGIGFNNPDPFYDHAEILQAQKIGPYYVANTLSPGSEMALTFKLKMPEPCNGDFNTGSIYFWGEAI